MVSEISARGSGGIAQWCQENVPEEAADPCYHGSKERARGHKNMNEKEENEDTPLSTTSL